MAIFQKAVITPNIKQKYIAFTFYKVIFFIAIDCVSVPVVYFKMYQNLIVSMDVPVYSTSLGIDICSTSKCILHGLLGDKICYIVKKAIVNMLLFNVSVNLQTLLTLLFLKLKA